MLLQLGGKDPLEGRGQASLPLAPENFTSVAGEGEGRVNDMIAAGVIDPSSSPWTSPVVPVRKKDGTLWHRLQPAQLCHAG